MKTAKTDNNKRVLIRVMILGATIAFLLVYLYLYLGIELELKFGIEHTGVNNDNLIDSSFKIRDFITIQLSLFITLVVFCLFLLFKKR